MRAAYLALALASAVVIPQAEARESLEQVAAVRQIEFQTVIEAKGRSADELYDLARDWFVEAFISSEAVLEVQDPVRGVLFGRAKVGVLGGASGYDPALTGELRYLIRVEVKEDRARCTLSQFVHESTSRMPVSFGLLTTAEDPGPFVTSMKKWRINNNAWLKGEAARHADYLSRSLRAALTAPPEATW